MAWANVPSACQRRLGTVTYDVLRVCTLVEIVTDTEKYLRGQSGVAETQNRLGQQKGER